MEQPSTSATILKQLSPILAALIPFVLVPLAMSLASRLSRESNTKLSLAERLALGRFYMECSVSLMLIGAGLYIIIFGHSSQETEKWATGIIGLVLGYWLKSSGSSIVTVEKDSSK